MSIFGKKPTVSKWNGENIQQIFNTYSNGVKDVYDRLGKDIQGCVVYVDKTTDDPYITFVFETGSKPDLSTLPKELASNDGSSKIPVKHEFRGPARLA